MVEINKYCIVLYCIPDLESLKAMPLVNIILKLGFFLLFYRGACNPNVRQFFGAPNMAYKESMQFNLQYMYI